MSELDQRCHYKNIVSRFKKHIDFGKQEVLQSSIFVNATSFLSLSDFQSIFRTNFSQKLAIIHNINKNSV